MSVLYLNILFERFFKLIVLMIFSFNMSLTTAYAGSFDKGSTNFTLAIGSGQIYAEDYLIVGAGVGYYLSNGLEVGLDLDVWTGGEPSIYEITPKLTYVFNNPSDVKPYIGVFYSRAFIENLDDSDSYGYRVGFYAPLGNRSFVGIGLVNTELQDCTETIFVSCSDTYSELSFKFLL